MEHSVTFTVEDGTEYRLTYDNETNGGEQMHYLLHENGVLKLECSHHAIPGDLTEEEFKSVIVPMSFLNCLGKNIEAKHVKAMAEASGDTRAMTLAQLIRPHVALEQDQEEYVESIAARGHSVELYVQLVQELEVERFARQLNAEPANATYVLPNELAGRGTEDEEDYVRPAVATKVRQFWLTYWPAIVWSLVVVGGVGAYLLVV